MKTAIYTCITGNYDQLPDIRRETGFDYICFTNNFQLKSDSWDVRYIEEPLDNRILQRKIKILGYQYLPEYELLIYMDAQIMIRAGFRTLLEQECDLDNFDMISFRHRVRDCIYQEINRCVILRKETIENALRMEAFLKSRNYPEHNGLTENTVIIRKNTEEVNRLMDDWFYMIEHYSGRDQLSFNYCLWKRPIRIQILNLSVFNNDYFMRPEHKKLYVLAYRLTFDRTGEENYHNIVEGTVAANNGKIQIEQTCIQDTDLVSLSFPNQAGLAIRHINIEANAQNSNSRPVFSGFKQINDVYYTLNDSRISFSGTFKAGTIIRIIAELDGNDENDLVQLAGDRQKIIVEQEHKITEQTKQLFDYEMGAKEREKKIEEQNEILLKQEKAITERELIIAEKEDLLARQDESLAIKNEKIAEQNEILLKQEKAITEREHVIAEKEDLLAKQDESLAIKNEKIAEQNNTIIKQRTKLKDQARRLGEQGEKLKRLKITNRKLKNKIKILESSWSYRLGRLITWLPRKILAGLGLIGHHKENRPRRKAVIIYFDIRKKPLFKSLFEASGVTHENHLRNKTMAIIARWPFERKIPVPFLYNNPKLKNGEDKIVVFDSFSTPRYLNWLCKKHPEERIILWFWNPAQEQFFSGNIDPRVEMWTYSEKDSKKYGIRLNTQFYFDCLLPSDKDKTTYKPVKSPKILFVGREKNREQALRAIQEQLEAAGATVELCLTPSPGRKRNNWLYETTMPYGEIVKMVRKTDIILDYSSDPNAGLSLRPLEALFFEKKLITNNITVKNIDFYHPNNIYILGRDKRTFEEFFASKYHPVEKAVKEKYLLSNWLKRFDLLENENGN